MFIGKSKKMGTGKGRAFTLIELLVVVSIISLLVAILLPALGKAKQQATLVMCATHLKTIGQGLFMYAEDNGDYLPPPHYIGHHNGASTYMVMHFDNPDATPQDRIARAMELNTAADPHIHNLGYLFVHGYIDTYSEILYCPSNRNTAFAYDYYEGPNNWPANPRSSIGRIRSSYSYLPQSKTNKDPQLSDFPAAATKWSNMDSRRSVALDVLQSVNLLSHNRGSYTGANILFGGGSVLFSQDVALWDLQDSGISPMMDKYLWRQVVRYLE